MLRLKKKIVWNSEARIKLNTALPFEHQAFYFQDISEVAYKCLEKVIFLKNEKAKFCT